MKFSAAIALSIILGALFIVSVDCTGDELETEKNSNLVKKTKITKVVVNKIVCV